MMLVQLFKHSFIPSVYYKHDVLEPIKIRVFHQLFISYRKAVVRKLIVIIVFRNVMLT